MADTDLGVLRRAPRPLEQRLERIARWRAQGLANGTDDSTFPVDATDVVVFASSGGGWSEGAQADTWEFDTFTVTAATSGVLVLTAAAVDKSERITLNDLMLDRSEYSISGRILTLNDPATLLLGIGADTWQIAARYVRLDLAAGVEVPADFGDWSYNGDAALVSGTPVLNGGAIGSEAGSMVSLDAIASDWSTLTLALTADITVDAFSGNGIAFGLIDAAATETYVGGSGTALGLGATTPIDSVACAVAWIDTETFYSGDGTNAYLGSRDAGGTTTTDSDAGMFATDGLNDYELTLTATTTGRASAVLKWNGTTVLTSTTDLYVPAIARLIIAAGSGSSHQRVEITAVTATIDG